MTVIVATAAGLTQAPLESWIRGLKVAASQQLLAGETLTFL